MLQTCVYLLHVYSIVKLCKLGVFAPQCLKYETCIQFCLDYLKLHNKIAKYVPKNASDKNMLKQRITCDQGMKNKYISLAKSACNALISLLQEANSQTRRHKWQNSFAHMKLNLSWIFKVPQLICISPPISYIPSSYKNLMHDFNKSYHMLWHYYQHSYEKKWYRRQTIFRYVYKVTNFLSTHIHVEVIWLWISCMSIGGHFQRSAAKFHACTEQCHKQLVSFTTKNIYLQ